jgi:hypothetical protein
MSDAKGVERYIEGLGRRLIVVSLSAINSMYRLLINPEYI